ncbi:hypothetical protein FACS1894105_07120 [Clostridia bacterium]|nr:hypothetical protein FACS1894105_07120 [Clostridia bacterium]
MALKDAPLTREEVKSVVEGRGAARRVPASIHTWIYSPAYGDRAAEYQAMLDRYPSDIELIIFGMPGLETGSFDVPEYRWLNAELPPRETSSGAIDSSGPLANWDALPEILRNFPSPSFPRAIPEAPPDKGMYRVGHWWYWLFERFWSIRGMENALCDFYDEPENVHKLFRALTDFYKGVLTRGKKELNLDAIYTTDDIGTQTGTFFSLDIFREFFKPYYRELIEHAHSLDMHFWLHSCGNIKDFIPDLIEIGLDVLHPIQKYTMDESEIAKFIDGRLCVWAGMDMQRVMPYGSPEDVRREVRFMIDTYNRKSGGLMITAGNGFTPDISLENLEAFLDETLRYGTKK